MLIIKVKILVEAGQKCRVANYNRGDAWEDAVVLDVDVSIYANRGYYPSYRVQLVRKSAKGNALFLTVSSGKIRPR